MEQFKEAESASTLDGAVALERTHPPPARPAAMSEDFRTAGSPLCGAALIRTILHADGTIASSSNATVVGWLDASESEFFNDRDEPAALFRIRYLDGELAGDEEDLEEHERALRARDIAKKCRELAGRLSRGDVLGLDADGDDDDYDEDLEDVNLSAALVEAALKQLVDDGEVYESGSGYAPSLAGDDGGAWQSDASGDEKPAAFVPKKPPGYDAAVASDAKHARPYAPWRPPRRGVRCLPPDKSPEKKPKQAGDEDADSQADLESQAVSEEDAEKAAMIADACFTAASAALDDLRGDLKQPRSAFALFKHDHTKDAVAATMDGHSLNDDPAPGWYRELVPRRSGDKVDAYYYPPDGTQLRSRPDVRRYFEGNPDAVKVGDVVLDTSQFQFAYSKCPAEELRKCKPLNRGAITAELHRRWEALEASERDGYATKAVEEKARLDEERKRAAKTVRDRAVEAAEQLGASRRDARLAAARAARSLFGDLDWSTLVSGDSPVKRPKIEAPADGDDGAAPVMTPKSPGARSIIEQLENEAPLLNLGATGAARPRRAATQGVRKSYRRSRRRRRMLWLGPWRRARTRARTRRASSARWGRLAGALLAVAINERKKLDAKCTAFKDAPYRATRDGLASLLRSGKARRAWADLSADVAAADFEDPESRGRAPRPRGGGPAGPGAREAQPAGPAGALDGPPAAGWRDDHDWVGRPVVHDAAVGRVVAYGGADGRWRCDFDDDGGRETNAGRFLSARECFKGVAAAAPCVAFPELDRDRLIHELVMIYWPMDKLFYEGAIVAAKQRDRLFDEAPPAGAHSLASEHLVLYDDGSSEWLDLSTERVRYVEASKAAREAGDAIQQLVAEDYFQWFISPVDSEALGLVDYHEVVKQPMDLGTVLFNADPKNPCASAAKKLLALFEKSALARSARDPDAAPAPAPAAAAAAKGPAPKRPRDDDDDYDDDSDGDWAPGGKARKKRGADLPAFSAGGKHPVENALRFEQLLSSISRQAHVDAFAPPPDFDLTRVVVKRKQTADEYRLRTEPKVKPVEPEVKPEPMDADAPPAAAPPAADVAANGFAAAPPVAPAPAVAPAPPIAPVVAPAPVAARRPSSPARRRRRRCPRPRRPRRRRRPRPRRRRRRRRPTASRRCRRRPRSTRGASTGARAETDYYEREHFAHVADKPYLGRVANGVWEIRPSLAKVALGHVLGTLVHSGHVVELADGGFVAANLYRRGVAFERKRAGGAKDARPDVELELSEYEIQRRERMARNEAMLKSLGF
ncbi:hypothetical protein JL722_6209 [Aureococcus anophagefferens]|nr:hypothetical protein JL722_6209 [Aureococcus anophagefferens]